MTAGKPSILIVDDIAEMLGKLSSLLKESIPEAEIRQWRPIERQDPIETFGELVDERTVLVITDYDLTTGGLNGLFGSSVVSWCQARFIPVGDFSRGHTSDLPSEPNLFELRVPTDPDEAAKFALSIFRGFEQLRGLVSAEPGVVSDSRSPSHVLASFLGRPFLESQFSLYMSPFSSASSPIMRRMGSPGTEGMSMNDEDKGRILVYVLGHLLFSAILRYPGPILNVQALCAYVGTSADEAERVCGLFDGALYEGPFSEGFRYYWREGVDAIVARSISDFVGDENFETIGEFNRTVVEGLLGDALATHECHRCEGRQGGFLCPFTERTVCERADCSVAASSWIPAGAEVCRVERDFYDEWAPLMGL
jgi:hypothetical protein